MNRLYHKTCPRQWKFRKFIDKNKLTLQKKHFFVENVHFFQLFFVTLNKNLVTLSKNRAISCRTIRSTGQTDLKKLILSV